MNRYPPSRFRGLGQNDGSMMPGALAPPMPGQPGSGALAPLPTPGTMPSSMEDDFFDPATDGIDIMWYSTPQIASIAPGANTSATIQIDSGVDFYWYASTYLCDTAVSTTESNYPLPLLSVLINDTGSRKNLQNTPVPLPSICGVGEKPYRLPRPRLFHASSTINFTFANYSGVNVGGNSATYYDLYFVMHGYTKPRGS